MITAKHESLWQGIIKPKLRAHSDWFYGGRVGDGRIVLSDENLQGTNLRGLPGARLERVDMSGAAMNILDDIELYSCTFDDALVQESTWKRAAIHDTRFVGTTMYLSHFEDARVDGGDWFGAWIERSTWTGARVENVNFTAATLVDSRFDDATFIDCDFFRADFSRVERDLDLARCPGTTFVRCDFRSANFEGLRLDHTAFVNCRFASLRGKPDLEGPCYLDAPDFSAGDPGGESANGVPGIRDPEAVLRVWRERDADYLRHWYLFNGDAGYDPGQNYPERKK